MTKYQETVLIKRAVQKQLKNKNITNSCYQFPHVEKQKKSNSEWPLYITDNPFYP